MDEEGYKGRLVIDEEETRETVIKKVYLQLRDWNPQTWHTPLTTTTTTLEARHFNPIPTAPTGPIERYWKLDRTNSRPHCPKCEDDICRCSGRMSSDGPPKCSLCNVSACVCNTRDQKEYQELHTRDQKEYQKLEDNKKPDQKVIKHETEDDVDYRSWCINSERRWDKRRSGKRDRPEDECVITHDESDNKCYRRWLEKQHREDPGRTIEQPSILRRLLMSSRRA